MRVDVFTIFPDLLEHYCSGSLLGRARKNGLVDIRIHDLRSGAGDSRRSVDDAPFGGGAGMVLAPEPIFGVVERVSPPRPLYLLTPGGRRLDQDVVEGLAGYRSSASGGFSLLCGRYEGVDQRVADHLTDGELSIGDYVLGGGELAALVVVEAVARLVPGVIGNEASAGDDSFTSGLLEYPQYTRPASFRGWTVPEVLLTGDHGRIARWRLAAALRRTLERRPDLVAERGGLSQAELRVLEEFPDATGREGGENEARPPSGSGEEGTRGGPTRAIVTGSGRLHAARLAGVPAASGGPAGRSELAPKGRVMNPTDIVDRENLRDDIPEFRPGDTLKVHVRVVEGNRERNQVFQGPVIRRQGTGARETFTVRKVSFGVGVERTFPVHSPILAKVEVVTRGDVRRAKLYYLRGRVGKAAKIKEKRAARS